MFYNYDYKFSIITFPSLYISHLNTSLCTNRENSKKIYLSTSFKRRMSSGNLQGFKIIRR